MTSDEFSLTMIQKRLAPDSIAETGNIHKQVFYHQNLRYKFQWDIQNHIRLKRLDPKNVTELWKLMKKITRLDFPIAWFNNQMVKRMSRFRLGHLPRGVVPKIGKELINDELITEEDANSNRIVSLTDSIYKKYETQTFLNNIKIGHDEVLSVLLKKDKTIIGSEMPVWNETPERITGHIDLLGVENGILHIIDFKPEGHFMRSLPQVAYYGLILADLLKIDNKSDVICSSFNREKIWTYQPYKILTKTIEILRKKAFLTELKNKSKDNYDWIDFFAYFN